MSKRIDTVVIGAGQAGLALSYHMTQAGREQVVLEKKRVGEAWRSGRWDSFTLVSPNWTIRLPGYHYTGPDPDGYLARDQVARYLEDYTGLFNPPIQTGVEVTTVKKGADNGLLVETHDGILEAGQVVVATSAFQKPRLPADHAQLAAHITQLHTSQYRNPHELPPGGVLVVGSAQSGCQIAEELYLHGRQVYLCTGTAGRVPRRYRGKDIFWWVDAIGMFDQAAAELNSPEERFKANPQLTGKDGGHALNLHQFYLDGVTLLGRLKGVSGTKIYLAGNLHDNLARSDRMEAELTKGIEKFLVKTGMQPPGEPEELPALRAGYDAPVLTELDLDAAGVRTIIWAIGYSFDFSWVRFPIFDRLGYPVQQRGVTAQSGLYFLGLQYLHNAKSSLLFGVGEDAAYIANHIVDRR